MLPGARAGLPAGLPACVRIASALLSVPCSGCLAGTCGASARICTASGALACTCARAAAASAALTSEDHAHPHARIRPPTHTCCCCRFGPIMNPGGAAISLTYIASEDVIPGYGGGMSSAKAVRHAALLAASLHFGRRLLCRGLTCSASAQGSRAVATRASDRHSSFVCCSRRGGSLHGRQRANSCCRCRRRRPLRAAATRLLAGAGV